MNWPHTHNGFEISRKSDRFEVRFAYAADRVAYVKSMGLRWDPGARCWHTPDERKALVLAGDGAAADRLNAEEAERIARENAANARRVAEENAARIRQAEIDAIAIEESRAHDSNADIPAPAGLSYLPYQRAGIAYAMKRENVLIGDDMGLGKTIQAVGIANADPSIRRVLIICPASLKLNWHREWRKWDVKGLDVGIVNKQWPAHADVVIINYDLLKAHRGFIDRRQWDLLIFDEAHYMKNPKTQRTKLTLGFEPTQKQLDKGEEPIEPIKARRRIMLTGTPIPNRPVELWPIVRALDPQGLGMDFMRFTRSYCLAHHNGYGWNFNGASNLDELQMKLRASIMVRRLKSDVLKELPPKRRQIVPLTSPEIEKIVKREASAAAALEKAREELEVLDALALADDDYAKRADQLRHIVDAAFEDMSAARREIAQAKLPVAIEHIRDLLETLPSIVVMAHHIEVVEAVRDAFAEEGAVMVHGGVSLADRQKAVDAFQAGEARVFSGGIAAAGVGLTLTRASTIVFIELDYVPGNITQAEDRVHRIGQNDHVLVQHLVADGSIDAKMVQILVSKQEVIDNALDNNIAAPKAVLAEHRDVSYNAVESRAFAEPVTRYRPPDFADDPARRRDVPAFYGAKRTDLDAIAEGMTDSQRDAVRIAICMLGENNLDWTQDRNGVGFNKADCMTGMKLANMDEAAWTPRAAALGSLIVRKYKRQYGPDLYARIFPQALAEAA